MSIFTKHGSLRLRICTRCLEVRSEYLSNIVKSFWLFLKKLKSIQFRSGVGHGEAHCTEALNS